MISLDICHSIGYLLIHSFFYLAQKNNSSAFCRVVNWGMKTNILAVSGRMLMKLLRFECQAQWSRDIEIHQPGLQNGLTFKTFPTRYSQAMVYNLTQQTGLSCFLMGSNCWLMSCWNQRAKVEGLTASLKPSSVANWRPRCDFHERWITTDGVQGR